MPYRPLLLTLAISPALAMDSIKTKTVPVQTLSLTSAGGIQSLVSAIKDDQEIVLIGHVRAESRNLGPFSMADNEAKEVVLPQLELWRGQHKPVVLLIPDSESTCRADAQYLDKNRSPKLGSHESLHAVINAVAVSANYSYGSLETLCLSEDACMEATSWDPTCVFGPEIFSELTDKVQLGIDPVTKASVQELPRIEESLFAASINHQKYFLSEKGEFKDFVQAAHEKLNSLSRIIILQHYYERLAAITKSTETVAESTQQPVLTQYAKDLLKELKHTPQAVSSYLASYGIKEEDTLLKALCTIIKCKRRMSIVCRTFNQELVSPFKRYRLLVMLTQATAHKHVVSFLPNTDVAEACSVLKSMGYTITAHGTIPRLASEKEASLDTSPLAKTTIKEFLSQRFDTTTPIEELNETSVITPYLSISHEQQRLGDVLGQLARVTQERNQETAITPLTYVSCKTCNNKVLPDTAFVYFKKSKVAQCSPTCLTKRVLIQKVPKLRALLEKPSPEDKQVIKHIAALCYLKHLTLTPLVTLNEGAFYERNLRPLIPLLKTISSEGHIDPTWQRAFSCVKPLCIEPLQLQAFLEIYYPLKDAYLTALKKKKSTKDSTLSPVLDEEDTLVAYLTEEGKRIGQAWLLPKLPLTHYNRVYFMLSQQLALLDPSKLENYLTVTIPKKNVKQPKKHK